MDQFLARLLDKYGLFRTIIAILIGFFSLWGLAHFTAAPGGNVSVLWGLVEYTKNKSDADNLVTKPQVTDRKQKNEASSSAASPVSPKNITSVQGVTKENVEKILGSLRSQHQLRALETLESGRVVDKTPKGTYFFVSIYFMETSNSSMSETISKSVVNRFRNLPSDLEIHYPHNDSPIVVGFTSESDAVRLASPSNEIQNTTLAAVPWGPMTSLVSVPTDRIFSSKSREIAPSEDKVIKVLDIEIK